MIPKQILYTGTEEVPQPCSELQAGPLRLVYDQGDLRDIRYGDHEIVARVYFALRDRNWDTIPNVLFNESLETNSGGFQLRFSGANRRDEIDFSWQAEISGDPMGVVSYRFEGIANTSFMENRIGLCVLHPMASCAGKECRVWDAVGQPHQGIFPIPIAPGEIEPFREMIGMEYEVSPGVTVRIEFGGDLFETEDQRNWTDASFKTFCTPLRLGYPREIQAGTRVWQEITISLNSTGGKPFGPLVVAEKKLTAAFDLERLQPLPAIGVGCSSHSEPLSREEISRLKALNLSHLRLDLQAGSPALETDFRRGWEQARSLDLPLEIAIHLSGSPDEMECLQKAMLKIQPNVCRWMVFSKGQPVTDPAVAGQFRRALAGWQQGAVVGGGTDADFYEINSGSPDIRGLDFLCYSMNPQVHVFDTVSLLETLRTQRVTVECARAIAGGKPVVVTPVTLKQRFNPAAAGPAVVKPGELPPQVDVRQVSLFTAVWTAGSIHSLASGGATSLTYFETTGWRGMMETQAGSPVPEKFHSIPGSVFPVYHVLADVGEFLGGQVAESSTSDPLKVELLALKKESKERLLVANLTPDSLTVALHGLPPVVSIRWLDETNAELAMNCPEAFRAQPGDVMCRGGSGLELVLLPYAVARVDFDRA